MSSSRGRWAVLAMCAALATLGCSYNLTALRGPDAGGDAGHDAGRDTAVDAGMPTRPPMTGTCTSHAVTDLVMASRALGGTLVVDGNTTGGADVLPPVGMGTGCTESYTDDGPEVVYRYVVRTGPRLVATTNGSECSAFDTILYALTSCDHGVSPTTELACDDDDGVMDCGACTDGGTAATCLGYASTITLEGLVPGDVIYLVVAGIAGAAGPFRLSVAENAGDVVPPPSGGATHCGCPALPAASAGVTPVPAAFPSATDIGTLAGNTPGSVTGVRGLNLTSVTSLVGSFRVQSQGAAPGGCDTARTIVDLSVAGTPVASFGVPRAVTPGTVVNILYTTGGVFIQGMPAAVQFSYRVRAFDPETCTGGFTIDTTPGAAGAADTLTLFGN